MLWRKSTESTSLSIDEIFQRKLKRYQLKQRVAKACTDTTDYELHLKNFLNNNRNNRNLIVESVDYRQQLIYDGCDSQQAAKQTLEKFTNSFR